MGVLTSKWLWLAVAIIGWTTLVWHKGEASGAASVKVDCTEAAMDAMIETAAANTDAFKQMRQRYEVSIAEARQAAEYKKAKNEKLREYRDAILTDNVPVDVPPDWMRKVSDAFNPAGVLAEPRAVDASGVPADP